jgi:hypothetical protein
MGWMSEGSEFESQYSKEFPLLHVHTSSGAHPASYPVGTGDYFSGGIKCPGCEGDHSPPISAEVKKIWI